MAISNGSARNSADVWRWLAVLLAGMVISGGTALALTADAPSRAQYDSIRAELAALNVTLARLEERSLGNENKIEELANELVEHIRTEGGR